MTTVLPRKDCFRLPSGAITSHRHILAGSSSYGATLAEIAFVLGSRLRSLEGISDLSGLQVVSWENVEAELAEAIQRVIGSRHPVVSLASADFGFRHGGYSPLAPRQRVVLLTDVLLTGRTASAVLRVIRRMEGRPVAIAAVIDGRVDYRAPIASFGGPIPVVSCFAKRLTVDAHGLRQDDIQDIDPTPTTGTSLSGRSQPRMVSSEQFLTWLRNDKESGVYVGHIDRGPTRHFSTYLNVGRLVATHPDAIDAFVRNIEVSLGPFERGALLRLVFPATEGDFARRLADAVGVGLKTRLSVEIEQVAAVRSLRAGWQLEGAVWETPSKAVIVDWGAVTTSTLRALISLAARNGASQVHAVVLTSQLDEEAEWQLAAVASVRELRLLPAATDGKLPFDVPPEVSSEPVEVPLSASFLAHVHMGMAASSECHLCVLAHQFRVDESEAPTRLLREHTARKYELYRPRPRREILRFPASDLAGAALSPEAAADIWNAHQVLEGARSSTAQRSKVRDMVESWRLGDLTASFEAWLRLLTVESYWLNRPPLDADDIRLHVGSLCASVILDQPSSVVSRELRWQAAIVLRISSKRIFVERFGEMLEAVADEEIVAAEVCYGMYTLLTRTYNHHRPIMTKALAALLDARDRLIEHRKNDVSSRDLLLTVSSLYRRAVETQTRVSSVEDPLAAWHALHSTYALAMNTHAGALTSILVVLNSVSGPAAERAAEGPDDKPNAAYWAEVVDAWSACWDFLASTVFPYLPMLRDLLEAAIPILGANKRESLLEFNASRAALLAEDLASLERDPTLFTVTRRRALEIEAFAWFEALLRAPEREISPARQVRFEGSQLLRLLTENPCELAHTWDVARGRCAGAGLAIASVLGEVPRGVSVFCGRSLLIETFAQIIENAAGAAHVAPGRPSEGVSLQIEVNPPVALKNPSDLRKA